MQNKSSTVIVASVPVVGTLQTIKLFTFLTRADCQMATCASNTFLVVISPNIFKQVYHQAPDSSLVKYFLKLTAKVQALKMPRLKSCGEVACPCQVSPPSHSSSQISGCQHYHPPSSHPSTSFLTIIASFYICIPIRSLIYNNH